jgi:uncharacterized protein YndB with AHSA1/START domain
MTENKDLKRLVRARMLKTGEAYTAARAQILKSAKPPQPRLAPRLAVREAVRVAVPKITAAKDDYAKLAGMSDAAVKAKTGCGWANWVKSLDHHGAAALSHGEIAELVRTKWKVGPWWGQMVAVGYERIKGLRARGQQRSGTYNATKSRTFAVPVGELFDAWANAATRKQWMGGDATRVRTATKPKSMRLEWLGGGVVAVTFTPKGAGRSSVAIEQLKLPSREAAAQVKEEWAARFDALQALLANAG